MFAFPSVTCGSRRSSCAIGESRTRRGAALPLYGVVVVSVMNLSRSSRNLSSAVGPGERLVEAEGGDHDVGPLVLEGVAVVLEPGRAGAERELVGRPAEVVEDQVEPGEAALEQRLEVPEVLHPLGQGVADQDDPVAFPEFEPGLDRPGRRRPRAAPDPRRPQDAATHRGKPEPAPECRPRHRRGSPRSLVESSTRAGRVATSKIHPGVASERAGGASSVGIPSYRLPTGLQ